MMSTPPSIARGSECFARVVPHSSGQDSRSLAKGRFDSSTAGSATAFTAAWKGKKARRRDSGGDLVMVLLESYATHLSTGLCVLSQEFH